LPQFIFVILGDRNWTVLEFLSAWTKEKWLWGNIQSKI